MIVEADGSRHIQGGHDNIRDAYLASQGWKVLRFWNPDMSRDRESVLDTILAHAESPEQGKPSSGPTGHLLPKGEGLLTNR
jgi:very-short-patch-repair endonuclease